MGSRTAAVLGISFFCAFLRAALSYKGKAVSPAVCFVFADKTGQRSTSQRIAKSHAATGRVSPPPR